MRKLIILAAFLMCSVWAGATACPTGYSNTYALTVGAQATLTADQANFPVYFGGNSTLAAVASGGISQSSTGLDVVFCTAATSGTILPYELVPGTYSTSLGTAEWFVQVPTVSHTAAQVIYVLAGKSGASDLSNKNGVWDANFLQVNHMAEASGTQLMDSTSNGNNSTSNANSTRITGKFGFATQFTVASSAKAVFPNLFPVATPFNYTISTWFIGLAASNSIGYDGRPTTSCGSGPLLYTPTTSKASMTIAGIGTATFSSPNAADSTWHYLSGTSSGTNGRTAGVILDNGANSTVSSGSGAGGIWGPGVVGGDCAGGYESDSNQELRISNITRSTDWSHAEYLNTSSPSTFYTFAPYSSGGTGSKLSGTTKISGASKVQ